MKTNLYIILYLLSNIFRTFNVYLFYETFFAEKSEKKFKKISYVFFYLVISLEYVYLDIPILTLGLNIVGLFALTFLYASGIKRKILGAGFILALLMAVEAIVVSLVGYLVVSVLQKGHFSSLAGVVCIPIVSYWLILIYRKIVKSKDDMAVPIAYWFAVIVVPVSCIYMVAIGLSISNIQSWQLVSIVVIMFVITLSIFMLYEKQIEFFKKENHRNVLEVQNQYYHRQIEALQDMETATKSTRHDLKNHLLVMMALAENNDYEAIREYVYNLQSNVLEVDKYIHTSNTVLDGLLNVKRFHAKEKGLRADFKVIVPENLEFDDVDCATLFGNLLDNAIENAEGYIQLIIRYDKRRLIVYCENKFIGERIRQGKDYKTSKDDTANHGFGLQNIRRVVKKYNGYMHVYDEDNVFKIDILMYL